MYAVMHSHLPLVNLVHLNLFVKSGKQYVYILNTYNYICMIVTCVNLL